MVKPGASSSSSSLLSEQQSDRNTEHKYKGVRKRKWGKWVSEIRLPNSRERIWLGSYDSPEKAARAFDAALYCLRGPGANLNFPDEPPNIVGGQSLRPQEIQEVAARFAIEEPTRRSNTNSNTTSDRMRGEPQTHVENYTSSSSDCGAAQMDITNDTIDWSFLNQLDSNEGASHFGLYDGLDHMDACEYYPSLPLPLPPPPHITDDGDHNGGYEAYSDLHSSFLWNF